MRSASASNGAEAKKAHFCWVPRGARSKNVRPERDVHAKRVRASAFWRCPASNLSAGSLFDCNANGVPDSCDNDCNANAINDAVEIAGGAADVDGDGRLDACERAAGNGNLDGIIGPEDLTMLLSAWGTSGVFFGDLDLNGTVAASDLAVILANWGSRP